MPDPSPPRIASLDQFRGYTVLGMFLVNFVGSYAAVQSSLPVLSHHHTYCSYADTIMPQFFFAVGFAYRMTFLRRWAQHGPRTAYSHALRRVLALVLLGFVVHHLDGRYQSWETVRELGWLGFFRESFQRNFFQTLTHIAVTSLWVLPVIAARPVSRIAFAIASALLFHWLSVRGYYGWVTTRPGIDGGPLGFLTWTLPTIAGTLAFDVILDRRRVVPRLLSAGVILMLLGYGLSCLNLVTLPNDMPVEGNSLPLVEPPFVPPVHPANIWTMSQRAGSASYQTFGAGFSVAVFALFVGISDFARGRVGLFQTLGTNALVAYILHELVNEAIKPLVPKDSPLWYVFCGFGISFGVCYVCLRFLERRRLFLRL
jgi:predicted acyltransferase